MTRRAPLHSKYAVVLLLLLAGPADGLVGAGRDCSRGSPFDPLQQSSNWPSPPPNRRGAVSLGMGIRSLLKNKLLGSNPNEDGGEEPAAPRARPPVAPARPPSLNEELAEQQREILQQKLTPAPLRMGEVAPGVVDATTIAEEESIQDKINRVKSGQMTEEEKRAFLATALSAGRTPESRKPLMKPKRDLERASASPFPSDSILRNFASGKVTQQKRDTSVSSVSRDLNTDAKKKEYLDMIMDPDRFTRRAKKAQPSAEVPPPAAQDTGGAGRVDDLGARLGVYAMEEEVRRQEAEKQRQREEQERAERERQRAMQKQAAEQHAAEVARRQQQLLLQAEEEKRRKEEEEERKRREEEKAAEQQRLQALIQQQEAYWTERLAKEREAKARREQSLMEASTMNDAPSRFESSSVTRASSTETRQPMRMDDMAPVQSSDVFNPNEMNLLDEAKHDREVDWERNQKAIEWGAAHTPGITPPPPASKLQTEPDFLEEQYRKKAEIDRAREEQFLRLKELNSPLPAPVAPAPAPAPSSRPSSLFRPPQPVPTAYRPTKSTIQDIQEAKKNAERHQQQDAARAQSQAATNRPTYAPAPPRPQVPPPSPAAWSSAGSNDPSQTWSSPYGPATGSDKPAPSTPAPAASSVPAEKKGPIRMQLPLGDAATDDEDGVDVRASTGMSIADAMRNVNRQAEGGADQNKRSKQWGVDMSRFLD